jgi:hypothetical protein
MSRIERAFGLHPSQQLLRCTAWLVLYLSCGTAWSTALPLQIARRIVVAGTAPVSAIVPGAGGTHVYVASGTEIQVYDEANGNLSRKLALTAPVVDMVIDVHAGVGYAALATPAQVVVFALRPLRVESTIALTDGAPSALLLDATANALYVESATRSSLAKFDTTSGKHLAAVHLDGALQQMAADGRGTLYVANMSHAAIDAVDTAHMTFVGAMPLDDCEHPTGLAMDPVGRRLFVACRDGHRAVVDTDMGFTFEQLPGDMHGVMRMVFGFHPFGPAGWKGGAFGAGEAARLTAIRMNAFISYSAAGSYPLSGSCQALALDGDGRGLWLAVAPVAAGGHRSSAPVELWLLSDKGEASK